MFFYYCFGFQSFIFFLFLYLHQWFKQTKDGICWIKENWFEIGIIMPHNRKEINHPCDVTKTIRSFIKQHVFHLFGQSLDQFYIQLMVLIIFLIIYTRSAIPCTLAQTLNFVDSVLGCHFSDVSTMKIFENPKYVH